MFQVSSKWDDFTRRGKHKSMKHIEDEEQKALFQWAEKYPVTVNGKLPDGSWEDKTGKLSDWLFAIPNGGKRNPREAKRFKAQGVKSGVSDLFLPIPREQYSGLWVEMKKPVKDYRGPAAARNAVTKNQKSWIELMQFTGYWAQACYGFDEARDVIEDYLDGQL